MIVNVSRFAPYKIFWYFMYMYFYYYKPTFIQVQEKILSDSQQHKFSKFFLL